MAVKVLRALLRISVCPLHLNQHVSVYQTLHIFTHHKNCLQIYSYPRTKNNVDYLEIEKILVDYL